MIQRITEHLPLLLASLASRVNLFRSYSAYMTYKSALRLFKKDILASKHRQYESKVLIAYPWRQSQTRLCGLLIAKE